MSSPLSFLAFRNIMHWNFFLLFFNLKVCQISSLTKLNVNTSNLTEFTYHSGSIFRCYRAVGEKLTVVTFQGEWFLLGRLRGSVFLICHSNILSFIVFLVTHGITMLKSAENIGSFFMRCAVSKICIQLKESLRPSNTISLPCIFPFSYLAMSGNLYFQGDFLMLCN